jgi:hypothetical protein
MHPLRYVCCVLFQKSGIEKLIPNMMIDDFLFEPCGYSMNGISKSVSMFHLCIHHFVTCLHSYFCNDKWKYLMLYFLVDFSSVYAAVAVLMSYNLHYY